MSTEVDSEEHERHMRNADALVLQGQMAPDADTQEHCYVQAFDLYVKVEAANPGTAAWKLACVAAHREKPKIADLWLRRAVKFGGIPELDVVETHYAFEKYRGQKWFKNIFLDIKRKAEK